MRRDRESLTFTKFEKLRTSLRILGKAAGGRDGEPTYSKEAFMPARKQKKSIKPKRKAKATTKTAVAQPAISFVDAEVIHLGESASWEAFDDPSPRCYVYTYEFPGDSETPSAPPVNAARPSREMRRGRESLGNAKGPGVFDLTSPVAGKCEGVGSL
jgi:hypothetical protein